jgi:cyclic pyranopterin phosphate synthase
MPECGIDFTAREHLLSFEEMLRLSRIFARQGINKIRITGGEPFVRKDLMDFLTELAGIPQLYQINITSNGTLLAGKIDQLANLGIRSINLSLDSLDQGRFFEITRRDELDIVLKNMHDLLSAEFKVKVNMVVMADKNVDDIIPMLELARSNKLTIRFLEEMPFNGVVESSEAKFWSHKEILKFIQSQYTHITKLKDPNFSTSANYHIKGFKGDFGIIASYSRTFCGTCNRIRVTPQGMLKTCLYDQGVFNIRDLMRSGADDNQVTQALLQALSHRAKDGHEAEARRRLHPISESMASIGG